MFHGENGVTISANGSGARCARITAILEMIGITSPTLDGGGLEGIIIYNVMASVVLIPFFLFAELQQSLGKDKLHSLILQKRSRADAA